ncbi:MAG: hypothetical protein SPI34_05210 [Opitutales bacterium]|nr:hypothetical protein [Opitutales bacterium]
MIIDLKKLSSPKRRPSFAKAKITIRRKGDIAFEPPRKAKSLVKIVYFVIIAAVVMASLAFLQSLLEAYNANADKAKSQPTQTQKAKEYVITLKPMQNKQHNK